jgi:hypothetical protein
MVPFWPPFPPYNILFTYTTDWEDLKVAGFPKLHIVLFKQFEGSRTFTNFIKPLLPKNELNNPGTLRKHWSIFVLTINLKILRPCKTQNWA